MFKIENLHVYVEGKHIVKGINLTIRAGETHTIMGPNGSGKSSLAYGLMGHPSYEIRNSKLETRNKSKIPARPAGGQNPKSKIIIDGKDISDFSPDERARTGLFLAFQHPISIPGVSVSNFLRVAKNSIQGQDKKNSPKGEERKSIAEFNKELREKAQNLGIKDSFLQRSLNEGFSGGEKKKLEMLQLTVLGSKYAVIDEIDTGLDVDALKVVARGIKQIVKAYNTGVLLITHYQRILHHLKPDFVHVMIDGKIVKTGDYRLAQQVEKKGYKYAKDTASATVS